MLSAAASCVAVVAGALLLAPPALASSALIIKPAPYEEQIFSTRASVVMQLTDETAEPFEWRAECAPAEPGGTAPPLPANPAEAPWFSAGGSFGPLPGNPLSPTAKLALGRRPEEIGGESSGILHHLSPSTKYFCRFLARQGAEEVAQTVSFLTNPAAAPEIVWFSRGNGGAAYVVGPPYGPAPGLQNEDSLKKIAATPTSLTVQTAVESNGADTTYHFEYTPKSATCEPPATEAGCSWQPFTSGAAGAITVAEDFALPEATATGLQPETTYFVRARATNSQPGEAHEIERFRTPTDHAIVDAPGIRNITATSAYLIGSLSPNGSETHWRFESSTEPAVPASWAAVPGAAGTVTQAEAEALGGHSNASGIEGRLSGLSPSTTYYVRLFAANATGEAVTCHHVIFGDVLCESIVAAAANGRGYSSFETFGPPTATTYLVHTLTVDGEALRLLGAVNPNSIATSEEQTIAIEGAPTGGTFALSFEGKTTEPIPFDAKAEVVGKALNKVGVPVAVGGRSGGPYTVDFAGALAEADQPELQGDGSGLTPSGSIAVSTTQPGGAGSDTHYHFEYEPTGAAGAPFSAAASTQPVDLGSGRSQPGASKAQTEYVGADLPPLPAGQAYRFRISATNTSPGNPVDLGSERELTVPTPPPLEPAAACPNQAARTGPSGLLPDCRAYEQLTPADKQGTREIFHYGGSSNNANLGGITGALPAEAGEALIYSGPQVHWGSAPHSGQSPYVFDRGAAGWRLTAAKPEPEAGLEEYAAHLLSSDYSQIALATHQYATAVGGAESTTVAYRVGPPGGPYATVATVPASATVDGHIQGWVVATPDFSKLILTVEDPALLKPHSTTKQGPDLYEYSAGQLRQLNLNSAGKVIGSCGAAMPQGREPGSPRAARGLASPNALSVDGSRAFFYAFLGTCPSAKQMEEQGQAEVEQFSQILKNDQGHLYMRTAAGETFDIGQYRFVGADAQGTEVLLEAEGSLYRYDTQTHATEPVPAGATLGRRYFVGDVEFFNGQAHLPGGAQELAGFIPAKWQHPGTATGGNIGEIAKALFGTAADLPGQVVRYDSTEHLLLCLSCASPFAPEPGLTSVTPGEPDSGAGGAGDPVASAASPAAANGDYAFFDTPAALLPADVDGERVPEPSVGSVHNSDVYSLSSDVYEWRRDGLDGCQALQGCLSLISGGRGGFLTILLGSAHEGRDVFFANRESLLPSDTDTSSDIYDARIGGGIPEPVPAVPCEGDACSHPVPAPNDPTPSSEQFHGAGNVTECPKGKVRRHGKCVKKHHKRRHHHKRANTNRRAGK